MHINFESIQSSQIMPCTDRVGFRDPTAIFHEGKCYCFYSHVELCDDGWTYFRLGLSISEDLIHWQGPFLLTEADRRYNYSSPGCIIRQGDEFIMCIQTYPTQDNEPHQVCGDTTSRIYLIRSKDLLHWSAPELMRVHGDDVSIADMGRMIDPYIVRDVHDPERYLVFYKQHPKGVEGRKTETGYPVEYMCYSSTRDLVHYQYESYVECGENVCVLPWKDGYRIYNSPQNGIGCLLTKDFTTYEREAPLTFGQADWPWAASRLTAGFVLDGRNEPGVGKYLMFFNGDQAGAFPFCASLGLAWSDDLTHWHYR